MLSHLCHSLETDFSFKLQYVVSYIYYIYILYFRYLYYSIFTTADFNLCVRGHFAFILAHVLPELCSILPQTLHVYGRLQPSVG